MSARTRCVILAAWAAIAVVGLGQATAKSHDALAVAGEMARFENQRILLLLMSGEEAADDAVVAALSGRGGASRLLRYEYQLAAQPASSVAGQALRKRFGLMDAGLPIAAILSADNELLGHVAGPGAGAKLGELLERHPCKPMNARSVLAASTKAAKQSGRHLLLYLSAPW